MTTDEQIIEQAVEAAARERYAQAVVEHGRPAEPWDGHYSTATKAILVAYFASLAEQGIVLVEQPTKPCETCEGEVEFRVRLDDMQHGVIPAGVMSLPGLARVYLERPEARLVFATAVGCGPVDPVFIRSEIERMGARVLACVHNGPCPACRPCEKCGGSGRYRDVRYWGTMPGSTPCPACNGSGTVPVERPT